MTAVRGAADAGWAWVGLGLLLGGALIGASGRLYALQGSFAELSGLLPVGYAFGAGMVAAVNPCGVLLLPSIAAYYLAGAGGAPSAGRRLGRALLFGASATAGFVLLFAAAGLLVGLGGAALAAAFPAGGLVVGLLLALGGAWLALSGRGVGLAAAGRLGGRLRSGPGVGSPFLFGVGYAVTSLSCTLPIFLVVAGSGLAAGGPAGALGQFAAYALGMGTVVTAVVLAAACAEGAAARWVRAVAPHVHRLSAAFMLGAGLFVVHYWLGAAGLLA